MISVMAGGTGCETAQWYMRQCLDTIPYIYFLPSLNRLFLSFFVEERIKIETQTAYKYYYAID